MRIPLITMVQCTSLGCASEALVNTLEYREELFAMRTE